MIILVIVLLGFLLILAAMGAHYHHYRKVVGSGWRDGEVILLTLAAIVLMVSSIVFPFIAAANLSSAAHLEAFYEANASNYQVAVDETSTYLSTERFAGEVILMPVEGSIEKIEYANYLGEAIRDWRDKVVQYNLRYQSMKVFDRNIWFGILYPTLPDRLTLLKLAD